MLHPRVLFERVHGEVLAESGSITAILTLLQKGGANAVPWNLVVNTIPGALIGGQLGSRFQGRISSEHTERLISGLFMMVGLAFLHTSLAIIIS